jgi:hypothetical protein
VLIRCLYYTRRWIMFSWATTWDHVLLGYHQIAAGGWNLTTGPKVVKPPPSPCMSLVPLVWLLTEGSTALTAQKAPWAA